MENRLWIGGIWASILILGGIAWFDTEQDTREQVPPTMPAVTVEDTASGTVAIIAWPSGDFEVYHVSKDGRVTQVAQRDRNGSKR